MIRANISLIHRASKCVRVYILKCECIDQIQIGGIVCSISKPARGDTHLVHVLSYEYDHHKFIRYQKQPRRVISVKSIWNKNSNEYQKYKLDTSFFENFKVQRSRVTGLAQHRAGQF